VNAILLSSQTESMLLKMNWKFRRAAKHQLKKRAAQFDVTVPAAFAGFDVKVANTPKSKLSPSITTASPVSPAAVAALAKYRAA